MWTSKLQEVEKRPEEIYQGSAHFKEVSAIKLPTATGTNTPMDFRKILLDTQNEEKIQQSQRDARAKNIIIHGIPESLANLKEHDTNAINELINTLERRVIPSAINRIGQQKEQGSRPIKITMTTLNDKEAIMKSLGKLKNAPEGMRKISITDDYTQEERACIREKVADAKQMTETQGEGKYVWRVRGTPKNGLVIKRFNLVNIQVAVSNKEVKCANQD